MRVNQNFRAIAFNFLFSLSQFFRPDKIIPAPRALD